MEDNANIERLLRGVPLFSSRARRGFIAHGHRLNRADAVKAVDFFRAFADRCHHGKEEKHLFPALAGAGMRVEQGPIGVMLAEHERGRALVKEMAASHLGRREEAGCGH